MEKSTREEIKVVGIKRKRSSKKDAQAKIEDCIKKNKRQSPESNKKSKNVKQSRDIIQNLKVNSKKEENPQKKIYKINERANPDYSRKSSIKDSGIKGKYVDNNFKNNQLNYQVMNINLKI